MKPIALACALALLVACGNHATGGNMTTGNDIDVAWERVTAAPDAEAQRREIVDFLRRNEEAGAPALQVSVAERDTGARAPIGDALWEQPDRYEVTLRFGERRYVFVPMSRASLEPLFRE